MPLAGVKHQAIMRSLWLKTILRSLERISRDKLMVIHKATLHLITKHRLPNWQLLILHWLPIKYFSSCHGNWKGISLRHCYPWLSSTMSLWKNSWCCNRNRTSWYFSIQGVYSRIGINAIIPRIHWMNILFLHSLQSSLSKSTWGKILRYYQHSSVLKILADESSENFGVFLFHTMRQTHPQLTRTIREKKFGQQLNEVSWRKEQNLVEKS